MAAGRRFFDRLTNSKPLMCRGWLLSFTQFRNGEETMLLKGALHAESPIYRGNARKTLFTRDGSGKHRLVSLAGEVGGTAEALMDAFIGSSRNGRNLGLLNRLWLRLYDEAMPSKLVRRVLCQLREDCYSPDRFFDLRMGLKLDEDRWASEANANYKMETLFRHAIFNFSMDVNDALLTPDNAGKLYYALRELEEGRFWFGAGKSKGLGRCRLAFDTPLPAPRSAPTPNSNANHLSIRLEFITNNPVLTSWNWGKIEPDLPAFAAVEGRLLLDGMRILPHSIRERLAMAIGGPILSEADWKRKFSDFLPRALAASLKDNSHSSAPEVWVFPEIAVNRLANAKKYPLSKKVANALQPLLEQPFADRVAAEAAFRETLGEVEAKKNKRVLEVLERRRPNAPGAGTFSPQHWAELAHDMGLNAALGTELEQYQDAPAAFQAILGTACEAILPDLYQQIEQQLHLLQSDVWIDMELENRRDHLRIKEMLQAGQIDEPQWGDPYAVPEGVKEANWREFLNVHRRVQYEHMLNAQNVSKSITNDENMIAFLQAHRAKARQELAQPGNIDFRGGGDGQRDISRRYGKPYDSLFMRMLSWSPSAQGHGSWEIYIPGSTVKGAFRKRAAQVLRTLWGDSARTTEMLNHLFGAQRQNGLLYFSDAYLSNPKAPEHAWCSMDGVRMDPRTGRPIEQAKSDYLFAYGRDLQFTLRIDLQDLRADDLEALSVLNQLLRDFRAGDIPLGGEKTNGFGWVQAHIAQLEWLGGGDEHLTGLLFGRKLDLRQAGIWQKLTLTGEALDTTLARLKGLGAIKRDRDIPQYTADGFVSHREFSGYCGTLDIEAEVLTPLSIQESGEPSYTTTVNGRRINGWDCFTLSPPEAAQRQATPRPYALPSKSLKGMLRHLYSIASDSAKASLQLSRLNPVDKLFGWVGQGQNQALMGRLAIHFGLFEQAQTAWFKVPYPYGEWAFQNGHWRQLPQGRVSTQRIANLWRLYPHAPLAPCVTRLADFTPDGVEADYRRAILPGGRCRFQIRFWNLEREELARLLWCIQLEPGLAHKIGKGRYLGFGSLHCTLLPESFLIDWVARYAGKPESAWRLLLDPKSFHDPRCISHYGELKQALDAHAL